MLSTPVKFADDLELDWRAYELRRSGQPIRLSRIPMELLFLLVERRGELVTRDEIVSRIWGKDVFLDTDNSINAAVRKLRQVLDDDPEHPRYLQTVTGMGYRFIAPVLEVSPPEPGPAAVEEKAPEAGNLVGKKVSHYRVLQVLGGGGMGVVYKAEDLKLGRKVAIKFLPAELASDSNAFERLEREARAASALEHPNICPIYELGEHEGQPFIVMQLLEGQTLQERIETAGQQKKPLPTSEVLDLALQIVAGLQAAHTKGIIHRDVKPANIFITKSSEVKILDFGLAKIVEQDVAQHQTPEQAALIEPSGASTPTATFSNLRLTRTGTTVGTAYYMSPEQVRGEKLDARTDVFSFGLVLYEMATGERAFPGDTAAVVHDAILHREAMPVRQANPQLPEKLEQIISKAIEKDPNLRYQQAADLRTDLLRLQRDTDSGKSGAAVPVPPQPRLGRRKLLYGSALAIVLVALSFGFRWFKNQQVALHKTLSERLLTHNPSENRLLGNAISPDGKYVAFVDTKGLYLSTIETGEVHDIPLPAELQTHLWDVEWFPDGDKFLLMAESDAEEYTIWSTSLFGGTPRKLRSHSAWPVVSPDGSSIAFFSEHRHEIWVMGANGENPHKIPAGENEAYGVLAWSPTGQRLAYIKRGTDTGGSIETVSLNGGSPSVVFSDAKLKSSEPGSLLWLSDGRMIFTLEEVPGSQNASNLWQITTDPETGKPWGKTARITNWDGIGPDWISVSRDGLRLVVNKIHNRDDVYVGELKEEGARLDSPTRLTVSESQDYPSAWTRDSKAVLFVSDRTRRNQIFRQQPGRDTAERLIQGPNDDVAAELSVDGTWILYSSFVRAGGSSPSDTGQLMRFPVLGGSPERVLEVPIDATNGFHCPSRPASSCALSHWEQGQLIFYALDPVQGRGKELANTKLGQPMDLDWSISPDGSRIAIASGDRLDEQIRILELPKSTERNLRLPTGWFIFSLSWTADGKALFATATSTSMGYFISRIELDGKVRVLLDRGKNQWLSSPRPSPDGRRLAFSQQTFESNAWLLQNF